MISFGLDCLLRFSKIKRGEQIGDIEALGFNVLKDGSQMGHLMIDCICHKSEKRFQIPASVMHWKITKFQKGALLELDHRSFFEHHCDH